MEPYSHLSEDDRRYLWKDEQKLRRPSVRFQKDNERNPGQFLWVVAAAVLLAFLIGLGAGYLID